jgi:hypothetical protein
VNETVVEGVRGDDLFYDVDLSPSSVDLDAGDQIWFRAARKQSELTDALAVIKKGRNVAGQSGIADIDIATAKFQVQMEPADTATLTDAALVFEVVFRKADVQMDTTVVKGVIRLTG